MQLTQVRLTREVLGMYRRGEETFRGAKTSPLHALAQVYSYHRIEFVPPINPDEFITRSYFGKSALAVANREFLTLAPNSSQ